MSRLIDADALIKYLDDNWIPSNIDAINKQPTVDAVPVVRCKNCKYGEADDPDFPDQYLCHVLGCDWNEGDHFCSNGKEKVKGGS